MAWGIFGVGGVQGGVVLRSWGATHLFCFFWGLGCNVHHFRVDEYYGHPVATRETHTCIARKWLASPLAKQNAPQNGNDVASGPQSWSSTPAGCMRRSGTLQCSCTCDPARRRHTAGPGTDGWTSGSGHLGRGLGNHVLVNDAASFHFHLASAFVPKFAPGSSPPNPLFNPLFCPVLRFFL